MGGRDPSGRDSAPTQEAQDAETARLVTRIQAGERDLFALLYMRYFDRVYSYLRVMLGDAHQAEDVAQRVFIDVLEGLPSYEARAPFRGWLFVIVRNQALNELRRRGRIEPQEPATIDRSREGACVDEELPALRWVSDRELVMFIDRLPLAQRQVLLLRFMLDMGHAEIARLLERSPEDVRNLQSRALRFLRVRLTALGRGPRRVRGGLSRRPQQAPVLRMRRFALFE
jgi:RNA polymerase sigma-70 factor (ECF subfamily)